jgi:endonuclease YncB( thermonuclease family)
LTIAGALAATWVLHRAAPRPVEVISTSPSTPVVVPASGLAGAYLPNRYTGKVVSVTDGDTIDVALEPNGTVQSVRLAGIDAPETEQAFGAQSTQHLSALVSGKTVTLQCENERSYGRLICKILLPSGGDVDLDQVKAGMAWHYKQYQDEQSPADQTAYAAAECTAMKSKIGLWADLNPVEPQDFRHGTHSPLLFDVNGCRISSEPVSGSVVGNARTHIFRMADLSLLFEHFARRPGAVSESAGCSTGWLSTRPQLPMNEAQSLMRRNLSTLPSNVSNAESTRSCVVMAGNWGTIMCGH